MKCSEINCKNDCLFVCTCKAFCTLCLTHLYYHSEICKKEKKSWEIFSSTSNSIIKQIQETKNLILNSAKKVIGDLQSLVNKSLDGLNRVMRNFNIFEETFKRDLKEKIRFCLEKVVGICKKCESLVVTIDAERMSVTQHESMNIDFNFRIEQKMPEFFEYCVCCMKRVEKIELNLIRCSEDSDCRVCLKCRSLDSTQCIICNKFYTSQEYLLLIS